MQDIFSILQIIPNIIPSNKGKSKEIFDSRGVFCGYLKLENNYQVVFYDDLGRFKGYFDCNKNGNLEKYDSKGNLKEYTMTDVDFVKYDDRGHYQGYLITSGYGNISEYNSLGQYIGYYSYDENNFIRFDVSGHPKLIF